MFWRTPSTLKIAKSSPPRHFQVSLTCLLCLLSYSDTEKHWLTFVLSRLLAAKESPSDILHFYKYWLLQRRGTLEGMGLLSASMLVLMIFYTFRYKIQETLFSVGYSTTNNISYKSYFRHNRCKN